MFSMDLIHLELGFNINLNTIYTKPIETENIRKIFKEQFSLYIGEIVSEIEISNSILTIQVVKIV